MNVKELATRAAFGAARLRARCGVGLTDAVCPFDLAEQLGLSVRLIALPSLEGVYAQVPRGVILVSSERPAGRRRYSCGHEIGHHLFGDGTCVDELFDDELEDWSPKEFVAHRFAAGLLMPKVAVEAAFARRHWSLSSPRQAEVYTVAQDLGVGYSTLVGHLERTLKCVSPGVARELRRAKLPQLRSELAGFGIGHDLVVADNHWGLRPVELDVGDVAIVPAAARFTGTCATHRMHPRAHIIAMKPGSGSLTVGSTRLPIAVRVSRRRFSGLARYRYLEDPADGR